MHITAEHIIKLYNQIEASDHYNRVLFYENHSSLIFSLCDAEQYYFSYHYIVSLFEMGKYEHVLAQIDPLIEYVFLNNVQYNVLDTFEDLLFKKASALHNTYHYSESLTLSKQLIGIRPTEEIFQNLAHKSLRSLYNWKSPGVRFLTLLLIFGSAIISALVWLVHTQYPEKSLWITFLVVISPCMLAIVLLGMVYLFYHIKSKYIVRQWVKEKSLKKSHAGN